MLLRLVTCTTVRSSALRFIPTSTATIARAAVRPLSFTVRDVATIHDALKYSGYSAIDFTIPEDAPTYDAVQKFAAFNIGCLVTTDKAGGLLFQYLLLINSRTRFLH